MRCGHPFRQQGKGFRRAGRAAAEQPRVEDDRFTSGRRRMQCFQRGSEEGGADLPPARSVFPQGKEQRSAGGDGVVPLFRDIPVQIEQAAQIGDVGVVPRVDDDARARFCQQRIARSMAPPLAAATSGARLSASNTMLWTGSIVFSASASTSPQPAFRSGHWPYSSRNISARLEAMASLPPSLTSPLLNPTVSGISARAQPRVLPSHRRGEQQPVTRWMSSSAPGGMFSPASALSSSARTARASSPACPALTG